VTHQTAFLKAILADTDGDDGPRLVYADWLDEHGDPRGEFIRVQCELARLGPPSVPAPSDEPLRRDQLVVGLLGLTGRECDPLLVTEDTAPRPAGQSSAELAPAPPGTAAEAAGRRERWEWLRLREQKLLRDHGLAWSLLPNDPSSWEVRWDTAEGLSFRSAGCVAVYRRGFVAEVALPLPTWLGGPCGRCGGRGRVAVAREQRVSRGPTAPATRRADCPDCGGTGRGEGAGPRLVRACPLLERVTFAGASPERDRFAASRNIPPEYVGREFWLWHVRRPGPAAASLIPFEVWQRLDGWELSHWHRYYLSERAALDALSRAALAWALATPPRPTP
jgi:uncharacterized protein (TIGR02996 family)